MLRFAPLAPSKKISGQAFRPPEDKKTIHQGKLFRQGAQLHVPSTEPKFFNSLDINYLRLIHFYGVDRKRSTRGKFECHQHGVFAIVRVITLAQSRGDKANGLVEFLGRDIGNPNFKCYSR